MSAQSATIATWTLALTASCLRFTSRRLSKAELWYDDWLIVPAMVSTPYVEVAIGSIAGEDTPSLHACFLPVSCYCVGHHDLSILVYSYVLLKEAQRSVTMLTPALRNSRFHLSLQNVHGLYFYR